MPRAIKVEGTLTVEELKGRYHGCRNSVAKSHWQMVWLKAQGVATQSIAAVTGYNPDWIRRVIRRYNAEGEAGIGDLRSHNGKEPVLTEVQQQQLRETLSHRAPDGGLWNGRKVALWIYETTGQRVRKETGWSYLRRQRYSLQYPRPTHPDTTTETVDAFKKNSRKR